MIECASVLIASFALAKRFNAVVSYEGDDPSSLDDLLRETKEAIKLAGGKTETDLADDIMPRKPWWKFW